MAEQYAKGGIKACGTEYGWTDVAFSDHISIECNQHLTRPSLDISTELLNEYGTSTYNEGNIVCTESGCTYYDLAAYLWPLDQRRTLYKNEETGEKFKVFKFIGWDKLSLGGSISVGCQGWGTPYNEQGGSIPNGVRSIHLITFDADGQIKEYMIECSVGNTDNPPIFDADKFAAVHDSTKFELIQDDDVFNCALVSVGLYGVIYSFYLSVEDAFFVKELKYVTTMEDLKNNPNTGLDCYLQEAVDGLIAGMELWVSPYKVTHPAGSKYKDSPPVVVDIAYYTNDEVPAEDNGPTLEGLWIKEMAGMIQILVTKFAPELAPYILQLFFERLAGNETRVLTPYEIVGGVDVIGNQTTGQGMPFKSTEQFWKTIDEWTSLMNEMTLSNKHYVANGGTSVRFAGKSRGFLDMYTNCVETGGFMMEQSTVDYSSAAKPWNALGSSPGWTDIFAATESLLMDEKNGGSQHWGLWFNESTAVDPLGGVFRGISADKMSKFVEYYQKFNVSKKFCNQFSAKSGLDQRAGFV